MWDGAVWRAVRLGEVAAWGRLGNLLVLGTATPTIVDDTLRYTDVGAVGRWSTTRVELDASVGHRGGRRLPAFAGDVTTWGSAGATLWVDPRVGIVVRGGTYAADLTQGFPGGRFASLALRFRAIPRPRRTHSDTTATLIQRGVEGSFRCVVERAGKGARRIRIYAPDASAVEIAGDFTAWMPVRLARETEGWWSLVRPLSRGRYEMNVRVDGGPWLVPAGLISVTDEFEGAAGLLMVP
jgi:hypothetical protein